MGHKIEMLKIMLDTRCNPQVPNIIFLFYLVEHYKEEEIYSGMD